MFTMIFTENINRGLIEQQAALSFPSGFTTLQGRGFIPLGQLAEDSLLILVAGEVEPAVINRFCEAIKALNKQECLMVVALPGNVEFV